MFLLAAYAGLRCCEVALVHAEDWDGRRLRVLGKGGKVRMVRVVRPELVELLDVLDGYAFPNPRTGQPIGRAHVSRLMREALPGRWTGHKLRHRYATVALDETKDILAVGNQLGHSRADTTQRYCRVATERLDAVAVAAAA
jgi:integrase/recombinase XerC